MEYGPPHFWLLGEQRLLRLYIALKKRTMAGGEESDDCKFVQKIAEVSAAYPRKKK